MLLHRNTGSISHHLFSDFPDLLGRSDIVVLNNTKVFPARLLGRRLGFAAMEGKAGSCSAQIEVLLVRQVEEKVWEALVKPGRKLRIGERVSFGKGELEGTILERGLRGIRKLKFDFEGNFEVLVDRLGHVPLPPYLARPDTAEDSNRYQTVFAKKRGAVAAPTAGLHFTPAVFDRLRAKGIQWQEITLHVGLGTFQPVRSDTLEEHSDGTGIIRSHSRNRRSYSMRHRRKKAGHRSGDNRHADAGIHCLKTWRPNGSGSGRNEFIYLSGVFL